MVSVVWQQWWQRRGCEQRLWDRNNQWVFGPVVVLWFSGCAVVVCAMPAGAPDCSGSVTSAAAVACVGFSASGAHSGGARSRWFLWLLVGPVVAPELAGTTLGCRGMVGSMFTSRLWHWCGCGWSPTALHRQTILPHPATAAGAAGGGCCGGM